MTRICAATALMIACASYSMPPPKAQGVHPEPSPAASAPGEEQSTASTTREAASAPSASAPELTAEAAGVCDLVCEQAKVGGLDDGSTDLARVTKNANEVLQAMQPDILGCYRKRIVARPQAHAFMTLDILVGPDGKVLQVDTTGGALLGEKTLGCIVKRVGKGTFEPPRRGGTLHIFVPFTLRAAGPGSTKE